MHLWRAHTPLASARLSKNECTSLLPFLLSAPQTLTTQQRVGRADGGRAHPGGAAGGGGVDAQERHHQHDDVDVLLP